MADAATVAASAYLAPSLLHGSVDSGPNLQFPQQPRERIAIASYPFRNFIQDAKSTGATSSRIALQDFAAHVIQKFNINKIEPWTGHFPSTSPKYLEQFCTAVEKGGGAVVNIAVDGETSPYAADPAERAKAVEFSKHWLDVAAAIGSHSIRTNIPPASDSKPDVARAAESLLQVLEYASAKNVVVNFENDNPVSEDPFFLVKVIEKVNSPWLHALPDFGNTLLSSSDPDYAYRGVDAMFAHAYCICHVKDGETADNGKTARVDMAKTFGFLKQHGYKGFCSMEYDNPGDPYQGTAKLIEQTLPFLA